MAQMAAKLGHWPSATPLCLPAGQLCSLVPLPVGSVGAEMFQMASSLHHQSDSDLLLGVLIPQVTIIVTLKESKGIIGQL